MLAGGCNTQVDYGEPEAEDAAQAVAVESQPSETPPAESVPSPPADSQQQPPAPEPVGSVTEQAADNAALPAPTQPPRYAADSPVETRAETEPPLEYDDVFGGAGGSAERSAGASTPEQSSPTNKTAGGALAPWETRTRSDLPADERYGGLFSDLTDEPPEGSPLPEVDQPVETPPTLPEEPAADSEPEEKLPTENEPAEDPVDDLFGVESGEAGEFNQQTDPPMVLPPVDWTPSEERQEIKESEENKAEFEPQPEPDRTASSAPVPLDLPERSLPPVDAERSISAPVAAKPTPINVDNTRHLAWMLGSKLSLAALEHLMPSAARSRSVPAGDQDWQVGAIAQLLNVTPPPSPADAAARSTPARAIGALLADARRLGEELSRRHGRDHAALVEIAVKTNCLVLLYEKNPALAKPIQQAVAAAAPRAELPPSVWEPLIELLDGQPSEAELRQAIFTLQAEAEQSLRRPDAAAK